MATDILTLLQQRGLAPKKVSTRSGGEYHSPCPGCGGNDRFCTWPEQKEGGTYYCRQCSKAGDLVQFLMDFENLSFRAASERLGKELKPISTYSTPRIPAKCRPKPPAPPQELPDHGDRPPGKWLEKAQAFLTWSREQLAKHPEQLEYLAKRGIRPAAVEAHGLGYNPGDENGKDLYRPREAWGLPPAEKKKNVWIPRGLVIPHHEAGQVCRLRIRRPEGEPRYYIIPGSTMQTMVLGEVKRAALVVESELDAVLLHDLAGDLVRAVALGSARTKPDARSAALLSQASLILLALDNDEAGAAAIPWWVEAFPQAKRWPVPQGKDPGDSYQAGIDLRAWIRSGFPEGWTIGQGLSSTPSPERKGGPAPRPAVPREVARLDPTEAVKLLAGLLAAHPQVNIYHTTRRVRLIYPPGWSDANWQAFGAISDLVFFGPGVIDYILEHPRREITAGNIIPKEA